MNVGSKSQSFLFVAPTILIGCRMRSVHISTSPTRAYVWGVAIVGSGIIIATEGTTSEYVLNVAWWKHTYEASNRTVVAIHPVDNTQKVAKSRRRSWGPVVNPGWKRNNEHYANPGKSSLSSAVLGDAHTHTLTHKHTHTLGLWLSVE